MNWQSLVDFFSSRDFTHFAASSLGLKFAAQVIYGTFKQFNFDILKIAEALKSKGLNVAEAVLRAIARKLEGLVSSKAEEGIEALEDWLTEQKEIAIEELKEAIKNILSSQLEGVGQAADSATAKAQNQADFRTKIADALQKGLAEYISDEQLAQQIAAVILHPDRRETIIMETISIVGGITAQGGSTVKNVKDKIDLPAPAAKTSIDIGIVASGKGTTVEDIGREIKLGNRPQKNEGDNVEDD